MESTYNQEARVNVNAATWTDELVRQVLCNAGLPVRIGKRLNVQNGTAVCVAKSYASANPYLLLA